MSQMPSAAAEKHPAGELIELIELERQEKNLVFHLQTTFLESDDDGFDRASEALSDVRGKIHTFFIKKEINTASDNKRITAKL